ncbi:DUF3800 domain-containing protein [Sutterella wadsworthensis]|uniref:DUF3800 domain-containing protein n=1 Tax=Sutterella wadsworthensis TaxID=40545 RepID=UPI0039672B5A
MKIFVASDESGVFDVAHNSVYTYGGLILFSNEERENLQRKYLSIERDVKIHEDLQASDEAKATVLSNKAKARLFRSLNGTQLFGGVVHQNLVNVNIFANKKSKQRYLDHVYKISLISKFQGFIANYLLNSDDVTCLSVCVDEHATATDGRYELRESLEQEFKFGTFNFEWTKWHPPIFRNIQQVTLSLVDSKTNTLVRAADIVANRVYHDALSNSLGKSRKNMTITAFP